MQPQQYQVLESFEKATKEGESSKYAPLMDGKIYKVPLKTMGHKSVKNLGMAIRAYGKRHNQKVRIESGKDYVVVQAKVADSGQS